MGHQVRGARQGAERPGWSGFDFPSALDGIWFTVRGRGPNDRWILPGRSGFGLAFLGRAEARFREPDFSMARQAISSGPTRLADTHTLLRSSFFVFSRSMWSTAQLLADWYIRHLANHMHPGHAVSARCVVQVRRRRVQTRSRRPPVELGRRQPPHTHSDASHLTRSDPVAQLARTNTSCSPMRAPT